MKANHTDITIVLDRSGSMAKVAGDTIGGFNRFLQDQQKAPGTAALTLHQFDHAFDTTILGEDIQRAEPLTSSTFVPRGQTALLDAMGRAILGTGQRLAGLSEDERAGKVVVVIITDGQENASRRFTRELVFQMIGHQRRKYSWQFVFLGANQDAIANARNFGIAAASAMRFASNPLGPRRAFESTSELLSRMRAGTAPMMEYTNLHREAQRAAEAQK